MRRYTDRSEEYLQGFQFALFVDLQTLVLHKLQEITRKGCKRIAVRT